MSDEYMKGTADDDHAEYVLAQINQDLRKRVAELEAALDKRDTKIKQLQDRFLHFTERVNEERDGYARAYEQDKERIAELESFVEAYDAWDTVEETWPVEAWERLSAAREALDK